MTAAWPGHATPLPVVLPFPGRPVRGAVCHVPPPMLRLDTGGPKSRPGSSVALAALPLWMVLSCGHPSRRQDGQFLTPYRPRPPLPVGTQRQVCDHFLLESLRPHKVSLGLVTLSPAGPASGPPSTGHPKGFWQGTLHFQAMDSLVEAVTGAGDEAREGGFLEANSSGRGPSPLQRAGQSCSPRSTSTEQRDPRAWRSSQPPPQDSRLTAQGGTALTGSTQEGATRTAEPVGLPLAR